MHELGILYHIVKQVEDVAKENNLTEIETLVLQVGQWSSVIPKYLENCYPAASDGSILENTELKIEIMPPIGRCVPCGKVFNLEENKKKCPKCNEEQFELLSGNELIIKEIIAR